MTTRAEVIAGLRAMLLPGDVPDHPLHQAISHLSSPDDASQRMREALGLLYDKYAAGESIYEDPSNSTGYLGNVVALDEEEEAQVLAALTPPPPAQVCVCGEPNALGVQHRTDGPCIQLTGIDQRHYCQPQADAVGVSEGQLARYVIEQLSFLTDPDDNAPSERMIRAAAQRLRQQRPRGEWIAWKPGDALPASAPVLHWTTWFDKEYSDVPMMRANYSHDFERWCVTAYYSIPLPGPFTGEHQ